MSDVYNVPKRRVQVEVRVPQLGGQTAVLFLSDQAEGRIGAERPSDIFNSHRPFIVAQNVRGGVNFLQCDAISTVTMDACEELEKDMAASEELAPEFGTAIKLAIALRDGTTLEGVVRYQLPEANSRVQDYLNLPERFMALYVNDKVMLINKGQIARVSPL